MYNTRQIDGRDDAILTDFYHGTKDYFDPDGSRVVQHDKYAYNYLHTHGGDLLRDVRSMIAEVEWNLLAAFFGALFKINGICIATSAERGTYNRLNFIADDVVTVESLKEEAG